jgi:hypothetical protein
MMDFMEWWLDNVLGGPFFKMMDFAISLEDRFGQFAVFACAGVFMLPTLVLTAIAMAATALLFVGCVLLSPIILPFTIWSHWKGKKA